MKVHNLKCSKANWKKYPEEVSWSMRNNDRDFKKGDIVFVGEIEDSLVEINGEFVPKFTGHYVLKTITKITTWKEFSEGINQGYCILDLQLISYHAPELPF